MAEAGLLARSALGTTERGGVVVARGAGADVLEHPFTAQLGVRLDPDTAVLAATAEALGVQLPSDPNRTARSGSRLALWLGPDEWLVVDLDSSDVVVAPAELSPGVTTVPLSGHRTFLEIRGPAARALLARGCPLDLDPRVFRDDACAQTLLARVDVIVFRLSEPSASSVDAFGVLVRASFARYVVDWLRDAITGMEANA
jgi:sarcosine oxidase, subunit gamma